VKAATQLRSDPWYPYEWTFEAVADECRRMQSGKVTATTSIALESVQFDLADVHDSIKRRVPEQAARAAFILGLRWAAILWGKTVAGPGADKDPVWQFILEARLRFPKKRKKDAIIIGMERYEAMTGRRPMHDLEFYQKNLSRMSKIQQKP
jgi:hypothetical protein